MIYNVIIVLIVVLILVFLNKMLIFETFVPNVYDLKIQNGDDIFNNSVVITNYNKEGMQILDKFEKEAADFHTRIRESYLTLAKSEPKRFEIINSNQNINIIEKEVYLALDKLFL